MTGDLSEGARKIFEVINFEILSLPIGLSGIVSNFINIIIFYKQGFHTTVNIAFFGLAISDLLCLLFLEWICICMNPLIASVLPWVMVDVAFLSGAWPHVCFCRITSYITIYITAERYISIAWPLKVKTLVTAKITSCVVIAIYIVNILVLVPEYTSSYLGWRFHYNRNVTLISLKYTSDRASVEGVENFLHSIFGIMSFLGVIVFTVALVTKLKKSSKWRKESSITPQINNISAREQKTVKMIVLIATVLIICYTPGAMISLTTFVFGPDLNVLGRYVNICLASWSIAYVSQTINSSVNIIVYYKMSSNYRRIFDEMFFYCFRPRSKLY